MRHSYTSHYTLSKNKARILGIKIATGLIHFTLPSFISTPDPNQEYISKILPWLYIGQWESAENLDLLLKYNITHILNVSQEIPNLHKAHFVYMTIPLKDHSEQNCAKYFEPAYEFIERCENNKGVLFVHCNAGVSRAPTMVIQYLVKAKRIPLGDAFNYIVACRPSVSPNHGFLFQLAQLEVNLNFGTSVRHLTQFSSYDYNNKIRNDYVTYRSRPNKGIYKTTLKLHEKKLGLIPNKT